jgi:hypothetical protein
MPAAMQIFLVTALWMLGGAICWWSILLRGGLRFEVRPRGGRAAPPHLDLLPLVRVTREGRIRSPLSQPWMASWRN